MMNKRKLGAAVLLLALGLGPVQTSQNYSLKLNNLAYAEEVGEEGGETGETLNDQADKAQAEDPNQDNLETKPDGSSNDEGQEGLSVGSEVKPEGVGSPNTDKVEKTNEETIKEALEAQDKAVRGSGAFKLATNEEITKYESNYSEIEKKVLEYLGEDKKIEDSVKELKGDFLTASMDLGYTVVKNLPKRMELRRLKAELEAASKKADKEYSKELKEVIKETDDILTSKEYTSEEIEENLKSLTKEVDAYKKENSVEIDPAKLSPEEAKYGYPDDVYSDTRGREKDLSELRLDARVMLKDYVDDEKAQARKAELDKKVTANTASEAEKTEYANLTKYDLKRLALAEKMIDPDIGESDLLTAINEYKQAADKLVLEEDKGSKLNDEKIKLVEKYEEEKKSDTYKNASEEKKKAYDKALEDFKNKKYTTLEELEAAKTKMEEAKKALSENTELEKEIESVLGKHSDFINTDNYRRATASYQNAYKDAYKALTDEKTKENLDKLLKAKKEIDDKDFVEEFKNKADQLESYIDKAKSDKITEESLKKLKEEYKKKLQDLRDDKDADTDDIKALEDEFNGKLNPEKAEPGSIEAKDGDKKKTTKKVVTSSKKSNGKVRTGVDAILPVVGGVAVVAAIALIFTRKKNK